MIVKIKSAALQPKCDPKNEVPLHPEAKFGPPLEQIVWDLVDLDKIQRLDKK